MTTDRIVRLGIVGAGTRGADFAALLRSLGDDAVGVTALCDTDPAALVEATALFPDAFGFDSLDSLLDAGAADAVLISTPMPLHAPMSIACLERGVHVLCEVPAAVSVDEARALVAAATASTATYAMAENYIFSTPNRMVRALAHAGCFGRIYWARGAYLHELRELNETTPWRRRWQTGVRGVTYPTHSIGPLLDWTGGERITRVACGGTGSHHNDPRGEPYHDDSATLLGTLSSGGLVEVRLDMISDRPHAMDRYQLQGTDGAYECPREGEGRVWLRELDPAPRWRPLAEAFEAVRAARGIPPLEPVPPDAGHGGGDYFVLRDFVAAIRERSEPATDVHRALDMTLPGLVSTRALETGTWVDVPDSRNWIDEKPPTQLEMVWPVGKEPPAVHLPDGYELDLLRTHEREAYVQLMQRAGFDDWTMDRFAWVDGAVLPDAHYVVRESATGRIVATALAAHRPSLHHPAGGELGWVATDPDHGGRGLGRAVCAAVLARFVGAGYRNIYLYTNTFRHPAVALYLKLGFLPYLPDEAARERWQATLREIGWTEAVPALLPNGAETAVVANPA
jgi:predicted dehydrogenase/ribosomal protein S18 acetylase RimI-like enzyme